MNKWTPFILLALIVLLGSFFRFYRLDEKSLWSDELATVATSSGNSIDPAAFLMRNKSFDPVHPVPAGVYRLKATQIQNPDEPIQPVLSVLRQNVHPPLFFIGMRWVIQTFGLTVYHLRLPAVIFSILGIVLIYGLTLSLLNPNTQKKTEQLKHTTDLTGWTGWNPRVATALLAAFFFACSGYQLNHAQDARQYTLLIDLALLAVLVGIAAVKQTQQKNQAQQIKQSEKGDRFLHPLSLWIVLAFILAVGLYTQYFFLVFVGFMALLLPIYYGLLLQEIPEKSQDTPGKGVSIQKNADTTIIGFSFFRPLLKKEAKSFWLCYGLMFLLMALLFLPWLPYFQTQMQFYSAAGHYTAGLWSVIQLPEKLWRILCDFVIPATSWGKGFIALLLVAFAFLKKTKRHSAFLMVIALWLFAVIGGQIVLDCIKQTHTATIRRYLILASPAWTMLLAYAAVECTTVGIKMGITMADSLRKKGLAWLLVISVSALVLHDGLFYLFQKHTSSDEFKQAAAYINQTAGLQKTGLRDFNDLSQGDFQKRQGTQPPVVLVNKSGVMAAGMAFYLNPEILIRGVSLLSSKPGKTQQTIQTLVSGLSLHKTPSAPQVLPPVDLFLVFSHAARSTKKSFPAVFYDYGYQPCEKKKFPGVTVVYLRYKLCN
ncbi:MAG: hypothetical protein AAGI66_04910 [Cyanobacteria bacterium P01_H01_bin.74]